MMVDGTHSDGAKVAPTQPMDGYAALYEERAGHLATAPSQSSVHEP